MIAALCVIPLSGCSSGQHAPSPDSQSTGTPADYLERRNEQWAVFYGVSDPPPVEVVRFVDTAELDATLRDCLAAAGYPYGANGGVDVPTGNEEAFALAQYTCAAQYPVPEKYTQEWSDDQLRIQYDWTVEFVIPCLESRNHPIADPPSQAVFVDSWASDPYFPFAQVTLSVSDENFNQAWAELEEACPQQAPGEVLWDGVSVEDWARSHGH